MTKNINDEIYEKLDRLIKRERLKKTLGSAADIISGAVILWLILVLLETVFHFGSGIRTIIFFVYIALPGGEIGRRIFYSLYFKKSKLQARQSAADSVGKVYPEIKDELLNAVQLAEDKSDLYSFELKKAAFERAFMKAKDFNFKRAVSFDSLRPKFLSAAAVFIITTALLLIFPGLKDAENRLLNFSAEFKTPPRFVLSLSPGNLSITKGENVEISASAAGETQEIVKLFLKYKEDSKFRPVNLRRDSSNVFRYSVRGINSELEYFAAAEEIKSAKYTIKVIDRPIITGFSISIFPPAYSGLPEMVRKDNGNIETLPGSKVKISAAASKMLDSALVNFSDSTQKECRIDGNKFSASFNVKKNIDYRFGITDTAGIKNNQPIEYSISMLTDYPPKIQLVSPDKDIELGKSGLIPLEIEISDDYGFSKLILHYRLSASQFDKPWKEFKSSEIEIDKKTLEQSIFYGWDLTPLYLAAEDAVSYYLEIFDNDNVSGPKSAKTGILTIRVPSINELFAEADKNQNNAAEEMKNVLKEAEKLQKEIKKIGDELKSDENKLSWEEKQKIEKSMRKFEELKTKTEEIRDKLKETHKNLAQNDLLSEETMEKYMELQKLLDEMTNSELKRAFEKMQKSLESLMKLNAQKDLADMQMNEEAFKKSLERTLNLLKRVQIEQKIDELLKRSEKISEEQKKLAEQSNKDNLNESGKKDAAKKQDKISGDLENFREQMENLQKMMDELSDMPKDELEKLRKEFEKQRNDELSEQAKRNLMNGNPQQANMRQNRIFQNMQNMNSQMMNMQNEMMRKNQMETLADMMKIINNLLSISKEQEKLSQNTKSLQPSYPKMNRNAKKQNRLRRNLENMLRQASELSQKTFAITPEMGKALGDALRSMRQSLNSMENMNGQQAGRQQEQAMASINQAAALMQGAMQAMMQSGGQGMMSMMQQLQRLSQQQSMLNQLTQAMRQGKLSPSQLQQMKRLARRQEMIRKSLAELNKEAKESGQSKKLSSNLDKILDEMQEVVTNMKTEKIDDKLVKAQERILNKLLDAQMSINERDYEKRRESKKGGKFVRTSPDELNIDTEEGRTALKDELLKSANEGYSKDYEELIKKYFEALEKKNN